MANIKNDKLSREDFFRLSSYIEDNYGIKMPISKIIMLQSRLTKRMRILNIPTYHEYCNFVFSKNGIDDEVYNMIDVVSTNKTDFFRENSHFDLLKEFVLREALGNSKSGMLNIWSAGCSSGEEAYTLAIVLNEYKMNHIPFDFSILGTDISNLILQKAQKAIYPIQRIDDISLNIKKKYFLKSKDKNLKKVRIIPDLRTKVKFMRHNLMDEKYNIARYFDLVFCRNTLIYFEREIQEEIILKISNKIKEGGYLFVGHSESLLNMNVPLKSVDASVYRKI
ncbi:MAG: hypothetical protein K8R41_11765 [Bacteroidales bacterium]|nr:hypothetical protein [Bacteroidales bacterium]